MFLVSLIILATLGLAFSLAVKSKSQAETARKANVQYSFWNFVIQDRITIIITYIVLAIFMMAFSPALNPDVLVQKDKPVTFFFDIFVMQVKTIYEIAIRCVAVTIGYSAMDLALRFFGRTTALIRNAIDYKTNIADEANGTLDHPTPVK